MWRDVRETWPGAHVTALLSLSLQAGCRCWRQREASSIEANPPHDHFTSRISEPGFLTVVLVIHFPHSTQNLTAFKMERFRNLLGGGGMSIGAAAHGTVSAAVKLELW